MEQKSKFPQQYVAGKIVRKHGIRGVTFSSQTALGPQKKRNDVEDKLLFSYSESMGIRDRKV